ncbi:hypothetical protein RDI58_005082 [Solanum bulbocastanum]|uniref:Uncharacterized protein n=1 Tax=Solanum bulbocastanum TaxID=147425 RepID=A0AAN8YM26_SOLBU
MAKGALNIPPSSPFNETQMVSNGNQHDGGVEFGTATAEFSTSLLLTRRKTNQSSRCLFTSSPSAVCIHISKFIIVNRLIFNRLESELYGHAVW